MPCRAVRAGPSPCEGARSPRLRKRLGAASRGYAPEDADRTEASVSPEVRAGERQNPAENAGGRWPDCGGDTEGKFRVAQMAAQIHRTDAYRASYRRFAARMHRCRQAWLLNEDRPL